MSEMRRHADGSNITEYRPTERFTGRWRRAF